MELTALTGNRKMKPLIFLANVFINTFGITQPTPEAAERSARFIALMILAVLVIVVTVAYFVFRYLYH